MLPQQLTTAAARHQNGPGSIDTSKSDQPSPAASVKLRHQAALGAEGSPIGRILDIAASDDTSVIDECSGSHRKAGIGRVRVTAGLTGCGAQPLPVDTGHHFSSAS